MLLNFGCPDTAHSVYFATLNGGLCLSSLCLKYDFDTSFHARRGMTMYNVSWIFYIFPLSLFLVITKFKFLNLQKNVDFASSI